MDFSFGSMVVGVLVPYVSAGIAIGIRQKSAKVGAQAAWGMAVMTVGKEFVAADARSGRLSKAMKSRGK